jgi:integrase
MSIQLRRKRLADGRLSLYLDVYQGGQRQYEFLKLYLTKDKAQNKDTLKLANSIRAMREVEAQHAEHGLVPAFKKRLNFVDYCERLGASKRVGEKAWPCALNHLRVFTGGALTFANVNEEWLEDFKVYLLSKVSANTAASYYSKIKAALTQAQKAKIIVRNPADFVGPIKKTDVDRIFLTLEDIEKLMATDCRDSEVRRAFLFCCFAGIRLSDTERLQWRHVQGDTLQFRQTKTQGFEYLPLSDTARDLLRAGLGDTVRPLPATKVFALRSRSTTRTTIKAWMTSAGIDKEVSFHTSRHTFATLGLTSGVDLFTVSKLLGHKNLQSTQVYAKIIDQKKLDAVAMLPKLKVSK